MNCFRLSSTNILNGALKVKNLFLYTIYSSFPTSLGMQHVYYWIFFIFSLHCYVFCIFCS